MRPDGVVGAVPGQELAVQGGDLQGEGGDLIELTVWVRWARSTQPFSLGERGGRRRGGCRVRRSPSMMASLSGRR